MLDFTLSPTQVAFRDYVHELAVTEMRPLALMCDQTEQVPDSFFAHMHTRFPGGVDPQARYFAPAEQPAQVQFLAMLAHEELAWGDAALATAIPGPGLAGPPILAFGSPDQQRLFLSLYDDDKPHWGALALTEPGMGSDISAISTTAVRDGDSWLLNGQKQYITNGARADLIITFATIDKSSGRAGIRPFVVPRATPGLLVGRIEHKMGLRASQTAELTFADCRVPADHLLADPTSNANSKAGFKAAMSTLDSTRPMVGALAVGLARAAYETFSKWVHTELPATHPPYKRREFDATLVELGQELLMARLLVWRAAWMADQQIANSMEASICKAYAGSLVMKITSTAARMIAPWEDPTCSPYLNKWFRDAKIFDIFEGTAQIQRLIIARRLLPGINIP